MALSWPPVRDCAVADCAFNISHACRAGAITLGREGRPVCKTYLPGANREEPGPHRAGVGACAMYMCLHNRDLVCIAYRIKVGYRQGFPNCLTYKNRYREGTN